MVKCVAVAALVMAFGIGSASAGVIASLAFTTPNGIVGPTDTIDVYATLTLDPSSDPLSTDFFGAINFLQLSDILANLFSGLPDDLDPSADSLSSNINVFLECSGTFFANCGGTPYDWNFAFTDF